MLVDPAAFFHGTFLLAAPHMDDEVLACGGTLALLPHKDRLHVVYATDGMGSPEPLLPWRDSVTPDLAAQRREEARAALALLGLQPANARFLNLADGRLSHHRAALLDLLCETIAATRPDFILMPFRYDRHPDHLILNHALTGLRQRQAFTGQLVEYFVYTNWRLLPQGDVRRYLRPELLLEVDTSAVADRKRAALDCFCSQTTCFYSWQHRPNLTSRLLDEVCRAPELFMPYVPSLSGPVVFQRGALWIRLAHRLEPWLKKRKDRGFALWRRMAGGSRD